MRIEMTCGPAIVPAFGELLREAYGPDVDADAMVQLDGTHDCAPADGYSVAYTTAIGPRNGGMSYGRLYVSRRGHDLATVEHLLVLEYHDPSCGIEGDRCEECALEGLS